MLVVVTGLLNSGLMVITGEILNKGYNIQFYSSSAGNLFFYASSNGSSYDIASAQSMLGGPTGSGGTMSRDAIGALRLCRKRL